MTLKRTIFTGSFSGVGHFYGGGLPYPPLGEERGGRTRKNGIHFMDPIFRIPIFTAAGQFQGRGQNGSIPGYGPELIFQGKKGLFDRGMGVAV